MNNKFTSLAELIRSKYHKKKSKTTSHGSNSYQPSETGSKGAQTLLSSESKNAIWTTHQTSHDRFLERQAASFNKQELSDVQVHVKNKQDDEYVIFMVNSYFLKLHSDVFTGYLNVDSVEERVGRITITGLDPFLVESMFHYMYADRVDGLDEIDYKLYEIAERFHVDGLRQICIESMIDNLSLQTLIPCLKLAFNNNLVDFKAAAITFATHNINQLYEIDEFTVLLKESAEISFALLENIRIEKLAKEVEDERLKQMVKCKEQPGTHQIRQLVKAEELASHPMPFDVNKCDESIIFPRTLKIKVEDLALMGFKSTTIV